MIGVSGMRGTIGGTLTPRVVGRMAAAYAKYLLDHNHGKPVRLVLGRDSRPSGTWVRDAAAAALGAAGVRVTDLGVVTTPGVAIMVRHLDADAGLVITASHNPIEWNGLKFLDRRGVAPPPDAVAAIRRHYDAEVEPLAEVEFVTPSDRDDSGNAVHVQMALAGADILGVSSRAYKVVLDSVNGAGCVSGATLLSKLGCRLVHLNNTPDGYFPHEPEPTRQNLTGLCEEVVRQRAAVGFAQDPDADRLAIVDETGTYIGEEYTLALCARRVLSRGKAGKRIVTNLSTSRMVDDVAARFGGEVRRTPVGEANVVETMLRDEAALGGEGNGGVIDPRVVPGRDSLVAMSHVLHLMAETGKTVSELVFDMPRYEIVKDKLPLPEKPAAEPALDAVSAHFADDANIEPILRIIAEAPDAGSAQARVAEVRRVVEAALS